MYRFRWHERTVKTMTQAEKLVWAAAFAAEFQSVPNRTRAVIAGYQAVDALRRARKGETESPAANEMLLEFRKD